MSHLKGSWGLRVCEKFQRASQRSLRTKDHQKGSDSQPFGSDGHLEWSKGHQKGEEGVVVNNKTSPLISSSSIAPGSHLPS